MPTPYSFALYDSLGAPLIGASPSFLVTLGVPEYRWKTGMPRTPPTIAPLGGNKYGFTASDEDVRRGVAFIITSGDVNAQPLFIVDKLHLPLEPFDAMLFTDGAGGLYTGPAPTVGLYDDFTPAARTPPALVALSAPHFFAIVPSKADLNTGGVSFRVDAPAASPPYFDGTLVSVSRVLGVDKASVLERFPELDTDPALSEVVWDELLDNAAAEVPVSAWADQSSADRAATWLTAHLVALEKQRLIGGLAVATSPAQLQSVTVGPVTKTFHFPTTTAKSISDEQLERTTYGREYMRVRALFCRARR